MSQQSTYEISCPQCRAVQHVSLHDAINVSESPELKAALMQNELNTVACEACGYSFRVDKALLYTDSEKRIIIYWMPGLQEAGRPVHEQFQQAVQALHKSMPEGIVPPEIHLVARRTEMIERIFLLEEGLDERIIEYIKYTIYTRNLARLDPSEKALLFDAQDSNEETLCFVVQDVESRQLESLVEYKREAYHALCEMFDGDEATADLLELFPGPYISAQTLLVTEAQNEV